jgi:hypothetical protein
MLSLMGSPESYLGKRRCDDDQYLGSTHRLGKRQLDPAPEGHQVNENLENSQFGCEASKLRKTEDAVSSACVSRFDSSKYFESQLLSLRIENQISAEKKDREILYLKSLLKSMSHGNDRLAAEKSIISEENTCLKRAVQILDKKQRDNSLQVDQLTEIVKKASFYIEELEKQNRNLTYHLSLLERGDCNSFDQPPPDIY